MKLRDCTPGKHVLKKRSMVSRNSLSKKNGIKEAEAGEKKYEKQRKINHEQTSLKLSTKDRNANTGSELCEKHIKDATEEIAEKAEQLEGQKAGSHHETNLSANWKKIIGETEKEKNITAKLNLPVREVDERLLVSYDRIRKITQRSCRGSGLKGQLRRVVSTLFLPKTKVRSSCKKVLVCENCGRVLRWIRTWMILWKWNNVLQVLSTKL